MKKLLMPIFGGILLTSSSSLVTAQNANTVVKLATQEKTKTQAFLDQGYALSKQSNLSKAQIDHVSAVSKTWDSQAIDNVVNQALQYTNGKLTIDKDKLNVANLPSEVKDHIDLALSNLNNAVTAGFIKVNVINNVVKLIYPSSNNSGMLNSNNNGIIEFGKTTTSGNKHLLTSSADLWVSSYGPSHWWRFWEWGDYVHFSEQLVQNAKRISQVASILNVFYIVKNIKEIAEILEKMSAAIKAGNTVEAQSLLPEFSRILNGADLTILGSIFDVVNIFTSIINFVTEIYAAPIAGAILSAIEEVLLNTAVWLANQMLGIDDGNGVKWQWANFIIPWGFSAE